MTRSAGEPARLKVFISYSGDDLDFASQLDAALDGWGFEATVDQHGISGADDWRRRLTELIRDADTIVFVLSPSSAISDVCAWEVEEALSLGKRIIPVLCRLLGSTAPPKRLADLNYIHFYSDPKVLGSGFGTGLVKLIAALNEDPDWMREHTRLLGLAASWEEAGRPASRLLFGDDIHRAKAWLGERHKAKTEPTDLHRNYIRASEDEAAIRDSAERRRLNEVATAQLARAKALAEAEAALQAAADAQGRRARLRVALFTVVSLAALVATGLGWLAYDRAQTAERERDIARKQTAVALPDTVEPNV